MKNKDLFTFLALTFGIGWFCMGLADIQGFQSAGRLWVLPAMWSPFAGALLASRQTRRELWSRVKKAAWRYWPAALVLGWSFGVGQQVLLTTLAQGHWNTDRFSQSANGGAIDSIHHMHAILGTGQQSFAFFAVNLVLSLILGSVITMIFGTVGEEAGWRGVLQPEMQRRFGVIRGTLLVGLIWGYWHLPVNLAGLNDPLHPILGALLIFPLEAISMSFVLAWLMNRSGSIWSAALAHSANNVLLGCLILLPNGWLVDQWTAIAVAIPIGALFAWLLVRDAKIDAGRPVAKVVGADTAKVSSSITQHI